ncbi:MULTISPECIES: hypothetical protein [Streptomyces]|uniref:ANTAR domain-containing protein n=2 Tax=Streptomyces TaxID=1883 RepID=A0ABU4KDU7_9ACTN|nr:hypothetical protein [Streptomyces roseolus]MDX2295872.1 hypothetical protein [Streptomyces roseolus]
MYGQTRILLVDRAAACVARLARVAGLAVRLATRTRMSPGDVYAAVATARFMAAHELIERAADQVEASGDPDAEVLHISTPAWFGRITLHDDSDEETQR